MFRAWLLIALFSIAQNAQVEPKEPKPYDVDEAYKVYSVVLSEQPTNHTLLISETTVPFNNCINREFDKSIKPAVDHYILTNKASWLLSRKFSLASEYKLLSAKEIDDLVGKPDPKGYIRRFPGGISITSLSAVGFNSDQTIAVVEESSVCGFLCGRGGLHILEKREGKWREMEGNASCFWMS